MKGVTVDMVGMYADNPIKSKKPSAAQLRARKLFAERARAGTLKKNPLTRVKVNSPPQRPVGNTNTPSKRLKKRRIATNKAPAGYYANPSHSLLLQKMRACVLLNDQIVIAAFIHNSMAKEYANMMADSHPTKNFSVVEV